MFVTTKAYHGTKKKRGVSGASSKIDAHAQRCLPLNTMSLNLILKKFSFTAYPKTYIQAPSPNKSQPLFNYN